MPYKDPEKQRKAQLEYYHRNKERIGEYKKKYKAKNKERVAETWEEWKKQNPERHKTTQKRYRTNNKNRIAVQRREYLDRKYAQDPEYMVKKKCKERYGEFGQSAYLVNKIKKEMKKHEKENK